jgi:hypothetical protein
VLVAPGRADDVDAVVVFAEFDMAEPAERAYCCTRTSQKLSSARGLMPPYESTIREHLAAKLEILEKGLTLVDAEHHLHNTLGASGFVDILARDALGCLVLIELKRSDSAARSAIHELMKYVSLAATIYKLSNATLRCMIVSTRWHELLVPFSEFSRSAVYDVQGFDLNIDSDGAPISARLVHPVDIDNYAERFVPIHGAAFFSSDSARLSYQELTDSLLLAAGIKNYIRMSLEHRGTPRAAYPHCDYLALAPMESHVRRQLAEQEAIPIDEADEVSCAEWNIEELLLARLIVGRCDEAALMTGTKLAGMLSGGWQFKELKRYGTAFPVKLDDDAALRAQLLAFETSNEILTAFTSSPRQRLHWQRSLLRIGDATLGMPQATACVRSYLEDLAARSPEGLASVKIFNPSDTLYAIVTTMLEGKRRYEPEILVATDERLGSAARLLCGTLSWDGITRPPPSLTILDNVFEWEGRGVEAWWMARVLGGLWQYEEELLKAHGLSYRFIEFEIQEDSYCPIREFTGGLSGQWQPHDMLTTKPTLLTFIAGNWEYCCTLANATLSHVSIDPLAFRYSPTEQLIPFRAVHDHCAECAMLLPETCYLRPNESQDEIIIVCRYCFSVRFGNPPNVDPWIREEHGWRRWAPSPAT